MLLDMLKEAFANDRNSRASKWIKDTEKSVRLWMSALEEANKSAAMEQRTDAEQGRKQMRLRTPSSVNGIVPKIQTAVQNRGVEYIQEEVYNQIGNTSIATVVVSRIRTNVQFDSFEPTVAISNYEYTGQCSFHEDGSFTIELWKNKYRDKGTQSEYESFKRRTQTNGNVGKDSGYGLGIGIDDNDRSGRVQNNFTSSRQTGSRETSQQNGSSFDATRATGDSLIKESNQAQEAPENGASFRSRNQFRLRPALQAGKEKIASMTSEQAASVVFGIQSVGGRSLLDPVRMLDRSAATPEVRALLYEVIEKPFNA